MMGAMSVACSICGAVVSAVGAHSCYLALHIVGPETNTATRESAVHLLCDLCATRIQGSPGINKAAEILIAFERELGAGLRRSPTDRWDALVEAEIDAADVEDTPAARLAKLEAANQARRARYAAAMGSQQEPPPIEIKPRAPCWACDEGESIPGVEFRLEHPIRGKPDVPLCTECRDAIAMTGGIRGSAASESEDMYLDGPNMPPCSR